MKAIMTRAHQIRKEAAAKWNCKVSEIVFGICLEMAHKDIRMEITANVITWMTNSGIKASVTVDDGLITKVTAGDMIINSSRLIPIPNHPLAAGMIGKLGIPQKQFDIISELVSTSRKTVKRTKRSINNVCPHCGTYCYGDCRANR